MNNPFTMIDYLGLREKHGYGLSLAGIEPIGALVGEDAEPPLTANDGPTTQLDGSGAAEGPPSVS